MEDRELDISRKEDVVLKRDDEGEDVQLLGIKSKWVSGSKCYGRIYHPKGRWTKKCVAGYNQAAGSWRKRQESFAERKLV